MDTKRMFELSDKHLMTFTKRYPVALVRGGEWHVGSRMLLTSVPHLIEDIKAIALKAAQVSSREKQP